MSLNARLMGRILSVQKILVGGIEQTPEGAVTDGKVTPYILIRGSTGNDAIVDSNGNLVCMLKGSENLPIAQDAAGNMVAVMKGDYDGALKTWKVDDDGRGEMFINDRIDVWGNINSMGLAEHASRTGSVLSFDGRGSLYAHSTAENHFNMWNTTLGTLSKDTTHIFRHPISFKLTPPATLTGNTEIRLPKPKFDKVGISSVFTVPPGANNPPLFPDADYYQMYAYFYEGSFYKHIGVRYYFNSGNIQLYKSGGSWETLATHKTYASDYIFNFIKVVFDLDDGKYMRVIFNDNEVDASAYNFEGISPDLTNPHVMLQIMHVSVNGAAQSNYFDDVIFTQKEPE